MKKTALRFAVLLSVGILTSCTWFVHHADPFYDFTDRDFPRDHLPLINPIEATRDSASSPWSVNLMPHAPSVPVPNSQDVYVYGNVRSVAKISVKNGVIMAYSPDIDMQADTYIRDHYYHWFVMIPAKNITMGFHTEDEFRQYIQTLGMRDPDWESPDEAFNRFAGTGCLEWIPDCK